MSRIAKGLQDVIACQSAISSISGKVLELAPHAPYEEVVPLVLAGELPTRRQLTLLSGALASARRVPAPVLALLESLPRTAPAMDRLRTAVSALGHHEPVVADHSPQANLVKALRLIGAFPTLVAALGRLDAGQPLAGPRPDGGHAEYFLRALHGRAPDEFAVRVLDGWMILHAEHTLNASTFAARVTASTLSDLHSAVVSGLNTLKGPLHGGANEAVLEMLDAIRVPERAKAFVDEKLGRREKIPGFGHRIYKSGDPRTQVLKAYAKELGRLAGDISMYEIAVEAENAVWERLKLHPNVDFYAAPVLHYLGVPRALGPAMFAMARVAGWCAHILEQYADNRLIRPEQRYIGPAPREWAPLSKR